MVKNIQAFNIFAQFNYTKYSKKSTESKATQYML